MRSLYDLMWPILSCDLERHVPAGHAHAHKCRHTRPLYDTNEGSKNLSWHLGLETQGMPPAILNGEAKRDRWHLKQALTRRYWTKPAQSHLHVKEMHMLRGEAYVPNMYKSKAWMHYISKSAHMCGCDTKAHTDTDNCTQSFRLRSLRGRDSANWINNWKEAESLVSCQSPFHPELLASRLLVPSEQTTHWLP